MRHFATTLTFALAFASCTSEPLPNFEEEEEADDCSFTMPASCPAFDDVYFSDTTIWENYFMSAVFDGAYRFTADAPYALVFNDSTFGVYGGLFYEFVVNDNEWWYTQGFDGGLGVQMPNCGVVGCYDLNEFVGSVSNGKKSNLFFITTEGGDIYYEDWEFLSNPDYPAEVCITDLSPEDCSLTGTFHGFMVVDFYQDSLKILHPDFADTIQVTDGRFHARLASY